MRQRKWEVDSTQTVGFISSFIRKKLALQKSDSLVGHVYHVKSISNLFPFFCSSSFSTSVSHLPPPWISRSKIFSTVLAQMGNLFYLTVRHKLGVEISQTLIFI